MDFSGIDYLRTVSEKDKLLTEKRRE